MIRKKFNVVVCSQASYSVDVIADNKNSAEEIALAFMDGQAYGNQSGEFQFKITDIFTSKGKKITPQNK